MIVAIVSGVTVARRASSSSSLIPVPTALSSSMAPSSKTHIRVTFGASTAIWSNALLFFALSRKIATAPESLRFHWICSGEEVS